MVVTSAERPMRSSAASVGVATQASANEIAETHPHANPPPDGEGMFVQLSFPLRGKVGMGVGLKERRLRRETLVSFCTFSARGPEGPLRGKVGMGVGLKERRLRRETLVSFCTFSAG